MLKLKRTVDAFPILLFDYEDNRRSIIYIDDNLVYFTKLVVEKKASEIFVPQDNDQYSIKTIAKTIATASNKKRLFIKLPLGVLWLLAKIKPHTISSLYGTLIFDSTASNQIAEYTDQVTAEDGLSLMSK